MKLFRHTGRYYLRKIKAGQLSKQQVAQIFNTSVDIVDSAYNDYCKEQNPFRRKSFEFKSTTVQIVISIISTSLVLFTLFEMQAARNATYLPDISLDDTEVAIAWNEDGLPTANKDAEELISKIATDSSLVINMLPQLKYIISVLAQQKILLLCGTQNKI